MITTMRCRVEAQPGVAEMALRWIEATIPQDPKSLCRLNPSPAATLRDALACYSAKHSVGLAVDKEGAAAQDVPL